VAVPKRREKSYLILAEQHETYQYLHFGPLDAQIDTIF